MKQNGNKFIFVVNVCLYKVYFLNSVVALRKQLKP